MVFKESQMVKKETRRAETVKRSERNLLHNSFREEIVFSIVSLHLTEQCMQEYIIHEGDTYPDARRDPVGLHAQAQT